MAPPIGVAGTAADTREGAAVVEDKEDEDRGVAV